MNKEFKRYLQARQKALEGKRAELTKRSSETEDQTELKSILTQLEAINDELSAVITALQSDTPDDTSNDDTTGETQSDSTDDGEKRSNVPKGVQSRGFNPMGLGSKQSDIYDSIEYRTAFMNFVCRGVPIPTQYKQKRDDQKIQANKTVSFKYFGVECKIAQTLLCNVTTLEAFQQLFVPLGTEALIKAIEIAIFKGNGTTQPLGILNDTRVPTANVIELTEDEISSWEVWHKKVFAKMKKSYRTGEFAMAQGTFDGYIDGMVDSTGQPIGRVNYGIDGEETYRFSGKTIETVEDDILPSWENASNGDVVAVFIKWDNYAINSNLQLTVNKWQDYDTNEVKNQVIMVCDGKILDATGVLIIKKKVE